MRGRGFAHRASRFLDMGAIGVAAAGGQGGDVGKDVLDGPVGFPGSDQSYSIGMPATAESAVSVAAWKTRNTWPGTGGTFGYTGGWGDAPIGDRAPFSSQGPTRDGRQKPDVSAPGMAIPATQYAVAVEQTIKGTANDTVVVSQLAGIDVAPI